MASTEITKIDPIEPIEPVKIYKYHQILKSTDYCVLSWTQLGKFKILSFVDPSL